MSSTAGQVIKCRAAVAWEPNKPLSIETVEVEPPHSDEVRVKIIATGVCHSDASFINGKLPSRFPIIMGHEGAGIVESVGDCVKNFKPGDHVIPLYVPQCFECKNCKSSKTNLCLKLAETQRVGVMPGGTTRFKCNGKTIYHGMGTSTFSEYTVVKEISLCKINPDAPLQKVCLIGCGISTGYGAALNAAKVEPGSVCGVWGLGGVGLAAVMGCRNAGASKIFGIDINSSKFELSKQFGCTDFVNPMDHEGEKIEEVLRKKTDGGFDYTFECIGNVITTKAAIDSSNKHYGVTTVVGVAALDQGITVMPFDLICGRVLKGSYFGGWKSVESIPKLVDEYMERKILVDEFITHVLPLDEINEAFDLMATGKSIRSVINM